MISSGDTSIRKSKVISRRIFIVSIAKVIVFTGIIGRLFSLQVNENKKYLRLSDKNRLREWKLPPVRGEFFDYPQGVAELQVVDVAGEVGSAPALAADFVGEALVDA